MKRVLVLFIPIFSFFLVNGQDFAPLSLQSALTAALENNKELLIANMEEQSAAARYKQTHAAFLPQIKLSYTALSTNNPLNAFGFKLQQQSITPLDFNPELLNAPSATENYVAKAEWLQPIINMDMLYMRRAANHQIDVYAFKTKRTREYLALEVEKAYAQLQLAHQANTVLDEALRTIKAIETTTSNRFEKGFIQKSDLLNVQVQVATIESQLAEAKSNVLNASDYLSLLMGVETSVVYQVDLIETVDPVVNEDSRIPTNRADFRAMQSAVEAQEIMMGSSKMSYLPKLNAFGEYLLNDNDALGFGSDSYLIGAQLSWSLFNGMATRNKVVEHRIERDKMITQLDYQKEQSQIELNKTIRDIGNARFSLQQSELAVEQASEALRILQNRYEQGLVDTNDLLQSQTQLSKQKLSKAQAIFQFNVLQAYLQFLTSTSEI
ncbi:MAG TPA: TolC family protein [Cyclobacteriaceae bacterium]|nr:TolC family protein [Cyclobacteriaceae bacterium]